MTQYPEAYLARELEMCYVNISLITDYDVGLEGMAAVSHHEVIEVFNRNNERVKNAIARIVRGRAAGRRLLVPARAGRRPLLTFDAPPQDRRRHVRQGGAVITAPSDGIGDAAACRRRRFAAFVKSRRTSPIHSAESAAFLFRSSCSWSTASASASRSSAAITSGASAARRFDEAWEEGRGKAGGILIATIAFYFLSRSRVTSASFFGIGLLSVVLQLSVAFLLIYTIPAAAIGGMPGNLAVGASFRAVRENVLGAVF